MNEEPVWYVIVRKDNGYPLQVYADEQLAQEVAKANGEDLVKVRKVEDAGWGNWADRG